VCRAGVSGLGRLALHVVKSCPPMAIKMGGKTSVDYSQVWFFFGWWSRSKARCGGAISDTGYLVPQPFAVGGNWVIFGFFGP
jgi:hypothetical protein